MNEVRIQNRTEELTATADARGRGLDSFGRRAWRESFDLLSAADRETPLSAEDLERLATAASLIGQDDTSVDIWARAHQEFLDRGDTERAARCAFWLAFQLLTARKTARGEKVRRPCSADDVRRFRVVKAKAAVSLRRAAACPPPVLSSPPLPVPILVCRPRPIELKLRRAA